MGGYKLQGNEEFNQVIYSEFKPNYSGEYLLLNCNRVLYQNLQCLLKMMEEGGPVFTEKIYFSVFITMNVSKNGRRLKFNGNKFIEKS